MKRFFIFSSIAVILAVSVIFFVKANSNNDRIAYEISLENLEAITLDEGAVHVTDCYSWGPGTDHVFVTRCNMNTSSDYYYPCPPVSTSMPKGFQAKCVIND